MTPKDILNRTLVQKQIDGYIEKYGWEFLQQAGNQLKFKNGEHEMIVEIQEDGSKLVFEDGKLVPNMYRL